ncbi:hypothetical protein BU26DRAFT_508390 [Trematosphaeria pertusa]|uniref:Uncharacterized protein n=1 Tax=Trematosphaeria pertusa TaxID=390896 RepID=A0A6A6I6D7_9PLEO|nr:uncharacterized protein BU26DRAFT_508390 [Trematosphaeria pertusa]KAF2245789.1 hypothetical protein BU26DRAFT_508390 [Trematosphaeria pertusa]
MLDVVCVFKNAGSGFKLSGPPNISTGSPSPSLKRFILKYISRYKQQIWEFRNFAQPPSRIPILHRTPTRYPTSILSTTAVQLHPPLQISYHAKTQPPPSNSQQTGPLRPSPRLPQLRTFPTIANVLPPPPTIRADDAYYQTLLAASGGSTKQTYTSSASWAPRACAGSNDSPAKKS